MIKNFKCLETKDSGLIYQSVLEQIKMLYPEDASKAGELAISAIELVLTGEVSTDDTMIKIILQNLKIVSERNSIKYKRKVENQKQKRIEENHLTEIADYYLQGIKQEKIAQELNMTQQSVSYWLQIIKKEYPELLKPKDTKNFQSFQFWFITFE